jgi:pimeloyl-ACP methyl ester carboxylesterase
LRGLIRGNAHNQFFFDKLKETFKDVNFYGLEVNGNGKLFKEESPTSIKKMVSQIRESYLKANKDKDADNYLVAISLGGMISVEWMNQYPGDFKKAILLNTSLKGYCPIYHRMLVKNIPKYAKYLWASDPKEKEEIIYSMIISNQDKHKHLIDHWAKLRKEEPVSFKNTLRQIFAAAVYSPPKQAPKTPIIIGRAINDDFVNPSCSKSIAEKWKLPLIETKNGGHDITNDNPEWVMSLIKEYFLSQVSSTASR